MRVGLVAIWMTLALIAVLCIREPRGEARHPLLVKATVPNPDMKMPAWKLMTLCPVGRRNISIIPEERSA